MVIAGSDVGNERAEHVERSAAANLLLYFDVVLYLIERDVAGAFYHYLAAVGFCSFGKFAESS